jgi:hypothetical protein
MWRVTEAVVEREFVCKFCRADPLEARYNTAIVVAQRTLEQLVKHHERRVVLDAQGYDEQTIVTRKSKQERKKKQ